MKLNAVTDPPRSNEIHAFARRLGWSVERNHSKSQSALKYVLKRPDGTDCSRFADEDDAWDYVHDIFLGVTTWDDN